MNTDLVLNRLVKREGMYTDAATKRRGTAQYVATFQSEGVANRLVLLINAPQFQVRELTVDRDGNVILMEEVLSEMRVERGKLMLGVDKHNEAGRGQILDVLVL